VKEEKKMPSLPIEKLLHFYHDMLRIRFFEELVRDVLHKQGLIRGSSHLDIGQEAVAVGAMHALGPEDFVISSHRGHGHVLAKGADPRKMFAEILGRRTGYCKGKGGSMHITAMDLKILGENPVVAAGVPIAAGVAFACKFQKNNAVAASFFGEGAINNGAFHEGMNLAALWRLPAIFICENNLYAISVPLAKSSPVLELHERAAGYGIPHHRVNGMDVEAVFFAVQEAAHIARTENTPSFLVCDTYRFAGHHLADLQTYRPHTEATEEQRKRDPMHILEKRILEDCLLTADELADYRERSRTEMEEACKQAMADPLPAPEEALEDAYA
jgi:TPP-dependent pyruvate/acetoin dehydrogenase alpha subunit